MSDWLATIRRYLIAIFVGNLAWETAQLPLYTVWRAGSAREIAFAVAHCTLGDILIAAACLIASVVLIGSAEWPRRRFAPVAGVAVAFGLGYTAYSEYLNVTIRGAWAYTDLMPTLPRLGTGLAPLAQWLVIPAVSLAWLRRRKKR